MEGEDNDSEFSSVVRQGTFDTDPTQTRKSYSSGAIKRGSLELPVIDDESVPSRDINKSLVSLSSNNSNPDESNTQSRQLTFNVSERSNTQLSRGRADDAGPTFVPAESSNNRTNSNRREFPRVAGKPRLQGGKRAGTLDAKMSRRNSTDSRLETYEHLYQERQTLLDAEVSYRKRIKQLEDELASFLKTIEDLTAENKSLRGRIQELEEGNVRDGKSRIDAESKIGGSRTSLKVEGSNVSDKEQQEKLAKLIEENNSLKAKIENLEKENKSLKEDSNTPTGLYDKLTRLEKENGEIKEENIKLKARLENLKTDDSGTMTDREKGELKSQIIALQTDNQSINEENIKLKAENLANVKKINELEKERGSLKASVTSAETAKLTRLQGLENEKSQLESERKTLKTSQDELEGKVKKLQDENKELVDTLNEKKTEIQELLTAMKGDNKLHDEVRDLTLETNRLKKLVDDTKIELTAANTELEETKIEKDKFESEKNKLQEESDGLKQTTESQEAELVDLRAQLEKLRKELDEYKDVNEKLRKTDEELIGVKSELEKMTEAYEEAQGSRDKVVNELKDQIEEIQTDNAIEKNDLKMEVETLKAENERLRKRRGDSRAHESSMEELRQKLEKSTQKNKKLMDELSSKEDRCANLETQAFQLNMKMEMVNKKMKEFDKDKKEWQVQKEKLDDIESSNKRLMEENKRLRIAADVVERGEGEGEEEDMSTKIQMLERKQKDAETRVRQLEGWVGDIYENKAEVEKQHAVYVGGSSNKRSNDGSGKKGDRDRDKKQSTKFVARPAPVMKPINMTKSLEDLRSPRDDFSPVPPQSPSLPSINERDNQRVSYGPGYRQLHKDRVKLVARTKKW